MRRSRRRYRRTCSTSSHLPKTRSMFISALRLRPAGASFTMDVGFPDCEDSRACSIHMSLNSIRLNFGNPFNNSRSGTRVGTKKGKEYKVLLGGPVYDVILKKKIKKKEDIRGNFKIPCSAGDLKHINALVYQGSDDVLVDVAEYVYPIDFVILDIKENEKRPFILGTPFLTTAKSSIKFDKGTITLRSGNSKASLGMGRKDKLHLEREMKFNQWRSKNFKGKHPTLIATKEGMDDEGEVTTKTCLESSARKFFIKTKFPFSQTVGDGCHVLQVRRHPRTPVRSQNLTAVKRLGSERMMISLKAWRRRLGMM
ncbi:zinc finger, CCHC-type containing protein [Tanacetum coccineum]